MEKLYFNKNIFTLYLKLLINVENANQSCKLFDNNAAVEINCKFSLLQYLYSYFEKGCRKYVHATIPKGNMGYDQYTVPDIVAVEPSIVVFVQHS